MSREILGGYALPVAVVANDEIMQGITSGLPGATVIPVRLMSPHNSLVVDDTAVSDSIDKRGYASLGVVISENVSAEQVRVQVSTDGNVWAYIIDQGTGKPWVHPLLSGISNAILVNADIFPFAFVRLVFTDSAGEPQEQTDVELLYCLIT